MSNEEQRAHDLSLAITNHFIKDVEMPPDNEDIEKIIKVYKQYYKKILINLQSDN